MSCPVCGHDPTADRLAREAALAEGKHDGAQCLRGAILLVLQGFPGDELAALRVTLMQVCEEIALSCDRDRLRAIDRFVADVQSQVRKKYAELERNNPR